MTTLNAGNTSALSLIGKVGATSLKAVAGTVTDAAAREQAKLEKTARAFEAVFVRQLLGTMRSAGFGDDLTGSSAVEQFQEMSDARTADTLSEKGTLGIAEMLLSRLAPKAAATKAGTADAATSSANRE